MAAFTLGVLLALWLIPGPVNGQSLLEFYRQGLETNPTLRSSEFRVDQVKAQEDQVRSALLPQMVATGNYYWNELRQSGIATQNYNGVRGVLQARQALLDLASYFRLQGAHFLVAQSEQEREAARMTLGGEVVDHYLTALQAADEIRHLQAEKEAVESRLMRLRFMRERELARVTDLYEMEAFYRGLLTREIEARNARAVAMERLRETTGLAAQQVAPLARESFQAVPGREDQWVSDAARNNPNLVALQHAIDAARKLIASGRGQHMPKVDLTATRTYSDQGFDNLQSPPYNVGTLGVQVTVPLYEGGRVQAVIREASARFEMAREQFEAARREIERDARTAYLSAVASHARIGSTNEEVRALEKVVEAQQTGFELGASTIADVTIALQRLFKARSDQSKARYDYIRNLTTLRVRAGALTSQDIEEIDGWMARK